MTAGLFAALALQIGFEAQLVPALVLTALIVPASLIDLNHRIIPDVINLPGAVLVYTLAVIAQPDRWLELLIGGAACFAFLGTAWVVSPKGMGLGDVKMALMIGLGLGKYAFTALFAAFMALDAALRVPDADRGHTGPQDRLPVRAVPGRRRGRRSAVRARHLAVPARRPLAELRRQPPSGMVHERPGGGEHQPDGHAHRSARF